MEVIKKEFSTETEKDNSRSELDNALKKRKAPKEDTRNDSTRKILRDGSEFFDDVSNAEAEPVTEDVVLEKEILNVRSNHMIQIMKVKQEISQQITLNEASENAVIEEDISFPQGVQMQLVQSLIEDSTEEDTIKNANVPSTDSSIEEHLDGSENEVALENLSKAMANRMSVNIDKVHRVVQHEFQNKNRQMEDLAKIIELEKENCKVLQMDKDNLEKENKRLKDQFSRKVLVKQEVFEENIEKTKSEYDDKLRNIDEERDYLMEEIRLKDEELKKKEEEIKTGQEVLKSQVSNLQSSLEEKGRHLQRAEDKSGRIEARLERVMKQQKPTKGELENKCSELERENDCMKEADAENKKKVEDLEDKMGRLEEQKYSLENNLMEKQLEIQKTNEKKDLIEKDLVEQKKMFQKELLDMQKAVQNMRANNDKALRTKDAKMKELEADLNAKKTQLVRLGKVSKISDEYKLDLESDLKNKDSKIKAYEVENKILREESQRHLEEKEDLKKNLEKKDHELDSVITEDLKIIEKDREEILELKSNLEKKTETLQSAKNLASEKTGELEKLRAMYDMVKARLVDVAGLKLELESRVDSMENTNFMLDMKVKEKVEEEGKRKEEITEMTNKTFMLEMKVMEKEEVEKKNRETIDMMKEEKADLFTETEKEKNDYLEKMEMQKNEMEENMTSLKTRIKQQIQQIQKSSRGKICFDMCGCTKPKPTNTILSQPQGLKVGQKPSYQSRTAIHKSNSVSQSKSQNSHGYVPQPPQIQNQFVTNPVDQDMSVWHGRADRVLVDTFAQKVEDAEFVDDGAILIIED